MVLFRSLYPFPTTSEDSEECRLEVAEFSAKSLTMGASLGKLVPINEKQVEDLRKKFLG